MTFKFKKLAWAVLLSSVSVPVFAADYYVAKNGSDSNPGTEAKPWRSLDKAANAVTAGDTVYFRAGTYNERLIPRNSGKAGSPIIYKAYPNEDVYFRGDGSIGPIVLFKSTTSHIVLDGMHVRFSSLPATGHLANVYVDGSKYITLTNLKIVNTGDYVKERLNGYRETGVHITNGAQNTTVSHSEIHGMSLHAVSVGSIAKYTHIHHNDLFGNAMNSVTIGSSKYVIQGTLIEHNNLGGSAISDGVQTDADGSLTAEQMKTDTSSRGVIVRYNLIHDNAENGIDLKAAANWVIEGNLIYAAEGNNDGGTKVGDNRFGGHAIHKGAQRSAQDVIIRNNVVYDSNGGVLVLDGYKVYNNVILNNRRDYTGSNSSDTDINPGVRARGNGLSIINNIIGDNRYEDLLISASGQELDHNIYFNSWRKPVFDGGSDLDFNGWQSWLVSKSVGGGEKNSVVLGALPFESSAERLTGDRVRDDFMLAAGSEAVDAGRVLTKATNDGGGSVTLKVKDARFFMDGYGVTDGDAIRIGDNAPVRIKSIDYANNVITLAKAMSWSSGDGVGMPYSGSAPDIGAVEYDAGDQTAPPTAPGGLKLLISEVAQ